MAAEEEKKSDKIGALWLKEAKSGEKYFSGVLEIEGQEKIRIVIFKTKEKSSENSPDYQILESKPFGDAAKASTPARAVAAQSEDDDIPF